MPEAARIEDEIEHSNALTGLLGGLVVGAIVGAVAAATVFTGGGALVVAAAVLGGAAAGGGIGQVVGSLSFMGGSVMGMIITGSSNVLINGRAAVRSPLDLIDCAGMPPFSWPHHGIKAIAQGSETVLVNGMPASRLGDQTQCSGKIHSGSKDTIIGGKTVTTIPIESEIPAWMNYTLAIVGLGSAIVLFGPIVAVGGFVCSIGGGYLGSLLGGAIFGEGSDGQKLMGLGGSILGGWAGGRFSGRLANLAGNRIGGPWGGFVRGGAIQYARVNTANNFYKAAGWPQGKINAHLQGIDFSKPVEVITLPKGTEVVQYQAAGKPTGNYFAPPGTQATELGISPVGRQPTTYVTTRDVTVLRSTAGEVTDVWTTPGSPYPAKGGGTQYFTPSPADFEPVP